MRIATGLTPYQLNFMRKVLVGYRIIKDHKPFGGLNRLSFDVLPCQFRSQSFSCHIALERIVTEFLAVVSKIRQRIIDLTDQKVLAIIQACDGLSFGPPAPKLIRFSPVRQPLSFA